jgi:hypothetical protein
VIAAPFDAGSAQVSVTERLPRAAVTTGAAGTAAGVTEPVSCAVDEAPRTFTEATVIVYAVPFTRPLIRALVGVALATIVLATPPVV